MNATDVDNLVADYRIGKSLSDLATRFGVHRRTVAEYLEQRGVSRRVNNRKLSEADVEEVARRYRTADSLATVGIALNVDATTVRRQLRRAGVAIRPRRGWRS